MDKDPNEKRLRRVEVKLNVLLGFSAVQLLVLLAIVIKQFLPTPFTWVLILVAVATFIFAFRNQIPSWFGHFSRYIFGQLFAAQKSDSMKD